MLALGHTEMPDCNAEQNALPIAPICPSVASSPQGDQR